MRIKDLTNAPQWLMNAIVSSEDVEIDRYGRVIWHGGDWHGGVWHGGVWLGGDWHGGVWHGGVWLGGVWHGGVWLGGVWHGGDWHGGDWHGGVWRGGVWHGGVWHGEKITRAPVLIASLPHWAVMISDTRMMIGCQIHTHAEWAGFDDAAIVAMDRKALRFWREYKTALLAMCEARKVVEVTP